MARRRVSVLILYNDKKEVLLQHRSKDAIRSPNHWGFFGGGIEGDETPEEALARESKEELSYHVRSPNFLTENDSLYIYVEEFDATQKLILGEGQGMGWWQIKDTASLLMSDRDRSVLDQVGSFLSQNE